MPRRPASKWFGKMPPDLSLISRVRGSDWIYTYLKSFYLDEVASAGLEQHSCSRTRRMPNPLWEMQGLQHAEHERAGQAIGEAPRRPASKADPARAR